MLYKMNCQFYQVMYVVLIKFMSLICSSISVQDEQVDNFLPGAGVEDVVVV